MGSDLIFCNIDIGTDWLVVTVQNSGLSSILHNFFQLGVQQIINDDDMTDMT